MNIRNVIATGCLITILGMAVGPDPVARTLEEKLDSLFIIASSGYIRFQDQVEPAIDSIAAMGAQVTPLLVAKLDSKSAREKWTVNRIITKIGSPAVPHLVEALSLSDPLMVARVCTSLGDVGDSTAIDPLIGVGRHEKWQVRSAAVTALGKIEDTAANEAAMTALHDSVTIVRKSAVVACGRLGLQQAAPQLVHSLGDRFYGARLMAIEALLDLPDTAAVVALLEDSLASPNALLGHVACRLLGRYGTDDALQLLFEQTGSADPARRAAAAEALLRADPEDLCGFQERVFERETDPHVLLKMQSARYDAEHGQP